MLLTNVPASLQDTDFIISLIIAGARQGHFYPHLANDKALLRRFVLSTIKHGIQDESGLRSQAMIGWLGNTRIGVTIITETEKKDNSIEIGVIAVKKQFQGSGYGGRMLAALLDHWLPHKTIYARCFPSSEKLLHMLLRRGFAEIGKAGKETTILKREQEQQPDHGLGRPVIVAGSG